MEFGGAAPVECWCGGGPLLPYAGDYGVCPRCGTLVFSGTRPDRLDQVSETDEGYYGRQYWFEHQSKELGLSELPARASEDLREKCPTWLRELLVWKLPPGKVLEIGAAHGALVAMLRWAGFDAAGLELSPSISAWAREHFQVPMLVGPLERQDLPGASFDSICLYDVLEHLPDPLRTLRECRRLLKPDGVLILQTPQTPAGESFSALTAAQHPFLRMLIPVEHIHLFTRDALSQALAMTGFPWSAGVEGLSPEFNMTCVASAAPVERNEESATRAALEATAQGRLTQSFLDLEAQFVVADKDRRGRLEIIERVDRELREGELEKARLDEGWRNTSLALNAAVAEKRPVEDAWRRAEQTYQDTLLEIGLAQQELANERAYLRDQVRSLERQLSERQLSLEYIEAMEARLVEREQVSAKSSRVDWRSLGRRLGLSGLRPYGPLRRIAIDLTPMLAGGENGGAKLLAIEQIRHFSQRRPRTEFVLLTLERTRDELMALARPNVRIVVAEPPSRFPGREYLDKLLSQLPGAGQRGVLSGIDLLYCPFTAPFFYQPPVPCVSVIHDLQYAEYPELFPESARIERERNTRDAVAKSRVVLCGTDFVRASIERQFEVSPEQVRVVPHVISNRLPQPDEETTRAALAALDLASGGYFLYPANFWPHKNHRMLLAAFSLYRRAGGRLRLVLTGAPGPGQEELRAAARGLGLAGVVTFAGFQPDAIFSALLASSRAMVFPSLYEGFGMPLLEAMHLGAPVLCSNTTCLPEVAGDAALYFDPRKPEAIARALRQIETDDDLAGALVRRGRRRVEEFGDSAAAARRVLAVLEVAAAAGPRLMDIIYGMYEDRWTGDRLVVGWDAVMDSSTVELELEAPPWLPHDAVQITAPGSTPVTLPRGARTTLRWPAHRQGGRVECQISPLFKPSSVEGSTDSRRLGVRVVACRVCMPSGIRDLLAHAEVEA